MTDVEVEAISAPETNGINGVNGQSYDENDSTAASTPTTNGGMEEGGSTRAKKRLSRLPIPGGMRAAGGGAGTRKVSSSVPDSGLPSPPSTLSPKSPAERVLSPKSPRMSLANPRSVSSFIKPPGSIAKSPAANKTKPATNGLPKPGSTVAVSKSRAPRSSLPGGLKQPNGASGIPKSPSAKAVSAIGSPAGARKLPQPSLATLETKKSDEDTPKSATLPRSSSNADMGKRRASLALSGLPTLSKKTSAPQLSGEPGLTRRASMYNSPSFGLRTQRSFTSAVSSPATTESGGATILETPKSATKLKAPASVLTSSSTLSTPKPSMKLRAPASALLSSPKMAIDSPSPNASPLPKTKSTSKPPSLRLKKTAPRPAFNVSGGGGASSENTAPAAAATLAPDATETLAETKKQRSISSSQALRDQIAKAKAARRSEAHSAPKISNQTIEIDFGNLDPFNHGIGVAVGPNTGLLTGRIKAARSDGKLNISNMDLKEIPQSVYNMYQMESTDVNIGNNDKWYENIDLVKFIAADNELSEVGDELVEQFGGLEIVDLHNNYLTALPESFTQLTRLSTLNLASNKLTNEALEVIFKIITIVDLNLSKNQLSGALSEDISNLTNLETLEIHTNKIDKLPESLAYLTKLKVLNASVNLLTGIPSLTDCPLVDLNVSSNLIKVSLFSEDVTCMKNLQTLDIKNNSLTCITPLESLDMPAIKQIMASNNQLQHLNSISGWTELLVFLGESNQLKELPLGVTTLPKLRILDITSNDISKIPPEVGRMDSLEVFKFGGNPIRERRLLGMNTSDLKLALQAKLEPARAPEPEEVRETIKAAEPDEISHEVDVPDTAEAKEETGGAGQEKDVESEKVPNVQLQIKPGGVLDLSRRKLEMLDELIIGTLNTTLPKILHLYQNSLTEFPPILSDFTSLVTLDISCNSLRGENYLNLDLKFTNLTSLLMHNNAITSLEPVTAHITAPKLTMLDVHANKLKKIPSGLRGRFPVLMTLIAQDNKIEEIDVPAVNGLKTLNLSNNEITHLPPRLGLVKGMKELRLDGNRFRVPKYTLLDKGTEAVLAWLRDKLPASEQEGEVGDNEDAPTADTSMEDGDESWYDPPN